MDMQRDFIDPGGFGATESYFPEFKKAAIDMIRAQGAIVGWTATVEQIARALLDREPPARSGLRDRA